MHLGNFNTLKCNQNKIILLPTFNCFKLPPAILSGIPVPVHVLSVKRSFVVQHLINEFRQLYQILSLIVCRYCLLAKEISFTSRRGGLFNQIARWNLNWNQDIISINRSALIWGWNLLAFALSIIVAIKQSESN